MTDSKYTIITATDHPEIWDANNTMARIVWPELMLHDPASAYFDEMFKYFPEYQFALIENEGDSPAAIGNCIPLYWDNKPEALPDDGWDWAIEKGVKDHEAGCAPNILCAIQVMVSPDHQKQGLSSKAVSAMKRIGADKGLQGLIAPVRPSLKTQYPITPIDHYVRWTNGDGLPFDPWMRVHARLGARIVRPCVTAMRIPGTVAEWEKRTGMKFPESGDYVVPGALVPVKIDCEADTGLYIEPNVWMHHPPLG